MAENQEKCPGGRETLSKILGNYDNMNTMMVEEMHLASPHDGLTGNYREEMWMKFFRSIIPQKFALAQGVIIIDSEGNRSKEVDIAVYDEQYTPYVFQYNTLKFIPIEAVVLVIESKSTQLPEELIEWAECIDQLRPSRMGIARIATGYAAGFTSTMQQRPRPIKILVSLHKSQKDQTTAKISEEYGDSFDFIMKERAGSGKGKKAEGVKFESICKHNDKGLHWWANELNNFKPGTKSQSEGTCKEPGDCLRIEVKMTPAEQKVREEEIRKMFTLDEGEEEDKDGNIKKAVKVSKTLKDLEIPGNALLTLNLQLNQLLMLLNNPLFFPHYAYAWKFQEIAETQQKDKTQCKE